MPQLLHESTGLKIVKNDVNRFTVVTLHYTADPAKRTSEWLGEAKAGMRPSRWAKEYEIDYTALYGQRVFPEIALPDNKIIVYEPYKEFSALQPFWGGFDFGSRNPSAFYVFTIDDGEIHAIWELYEPTKNIPDLASKILSCPYYNQIKYIACDPVITNQKTRTNKAGDLVTLGELLREEGIKKLMPGNNAEQPWVESIRKHWQDPTDPTFRIWSRCPNMIREFKNAVYASQSDRELLTQTYKEDIEDVNNHAMDACKYFMNSRPTTRNLSPIKDPEMWRRWMK